MRWQALVECVLALRPDWDVAELGAFRHLEGGYSNENYRFRYRDAEFVVRLPGRPNPYVDRAREQRFYAAMADLAMSDLAMPEVIAFDRTSGIMISRWISGRLLADMDPPAERLGDYLRTLHAQLRAGGGATVLDRCYDPLAQARGNLAQSEVPDWIAALADRLEWDPPELAPCHNDLNPWNVIEAPDGRWFTLDWEWAGANDPLFDLVALHQGLGKSDTLLPSIAQGLIGRAPESGRLDVCLTVFWLREFTWANAEIASGNTRPELLAQRELGARRLRALAVQDSSGHRRRSRT